MAPTAALPPVPAPPGPPEPRNPRLGKPGDGLRMQAFAGGLVAAVTACLAARFLTRYLRAQSLLPFGIYCLAAGILCTIGFA